MADLRPLWLAVPRGQGPLHLLLSITSMMMMIVLLHPLLLILHPCLLHPDYHRMSTRPR